MASAAKSARTSDAPRVADRSSACPRASGATASAMISERASANVTGPGYHPGSELWPAFEVRAMVRVPVSYSTDLLERTLPIAMLSLALVAVPVLILEPEGLPRLRGLQKELDDVTGENDDLRREVERLRVEVRELRDDPAAIERIARGELGMVRKSEVVFQFGR
jgi:cell division protein FtsB